MERTAQIAKNFITNLSRVQRTGLADADVPRYLHFYKTERSQRASS